MAENKQLHRFLWIRRLGDDALFGAFRVFCSEILDFGLDTLPGPPLDHGNPAAYVSAEVELAERIDELAQHNETILIPLGDGAGTATMISLMLVRCAPARSMRLRFLANGRDSLTAVRDLLGLMQQPRDLVVPPSCIAPYLTNILPQSASVPQDFGFMHILSEVPRGNAYRCVYVLQLFLGAVCHDLKNSLACMLGKGLPPLLEPNESLGGVAVEALPSLIRAMPVVNEDESLLDEFACALENLRKYRGDRTTACVNKLKSTHIYRRFRDGTSTSSVCAG